MLYKDKPTEPVDTDGTKSVYDIVQKQLEREFHVEKTYLAIAVWAQNEGLVEMGKFFMDRAAEEKEHAVQHMNILLTCGKTPIIPTTLDELPALDCIDCCLDHTYITEKDFTKYFAKMYKAAIDEGNGKIMNFAMEFLEEQIEEEKWALSLLHMWKTCDGSKVDFEVLIEAYRKDLCTHGLGLKV